MQFLYPSLTWGFLLVLLPVLIHLINRLRNQRVAWAAMQFLRASYRKHQRWIWLKQLLLLATRMAALAAVVAMLAHLVTQQEWLGWFGGQTTHHIVLVDDSLSMGDRSRDGVAAFDRARESLQQLVRTARQSGRPQKLTVLRYSRAARAGMASDTEPATPTTAVGSSSSTSSPAPNAANASPPAGDQGARSTETLLTLADVQAAPLTASLEQSLWGAESEEGSWRPSEQPVGLEPALDLTAQLIGDASRDRSVLHVLSDFRHTEWNAPEGIRERLGRLARQRVEVHLVRCATEPDTNLAVTALQPEVGTQAAGVPLFMKVTVKNFGTTAAERVALKIRSVFHPTGATGAESDAQASELPSLVLDRINPGETITRQFQVFFATAGQHVVEVDLPNDALVEDNHRTCVVPLETSESVLVLDGDPAGKSAYYLEAIFQPGTRTRTGVSPTVQPLDYLRDVALEELFRYRAIYLLDPPSLDDRSQANLQAYLAQGGGIATFVGEQFNGPFLSRAYEAGWFPAPLERLDAIPADADATAGSLELSDSPVFRALSGQRNPFTSSIRVRRYARTAANWQPATDSGIQTLARLHNGVPLVLERRVGTGRSVAFLTSLAPDWNNWAMEPSFVVVVLQLQAYLSETQRPHVEQLVGSPLSWTLDGAEYRPEFKVTAAAGTERTRQYDKIAVPRSPEQPLELVARLGAEPPAGVGPGETDTQGVYDGELQTLAGPVHHRRWALNVSTLDSDLTLVDAPALRQRMLPLSVNIRGFDQALNVSGLGASNPWSLWLLAGSVLLLLLEQWLAYRFSYHPAPLPAGGGSSV